MTRGIKVKDGKGCLSWFRSCFFIEDHAQRFTTENILGEYVIFTCNMIYFFNREKFIVQVEKAL